MKNILSEPLTDQFFANEFPGFNDPVTLADNVFDTRVPVVSMDLGIDVDRICELARSLIIPQHNRPSYPYEDYPRMKDWGVNPIISDGTLHLWLEDVYYKKFGPKVPYREAKGTAKEIQDILSSHGLNLRICAIASFPSGGYVGPHRDIQLTPHPLCYFYLPLYYPKGSELKIYPYGTVDIEVGKIYFMDQQNYVHAARNLSDELRYVLIGFLNSDQISSELTEKFIQAIREQYTVIN